MTDFNRLTVLRDFLFTVDPGKFDMAYYFSGIDRYTVEAGLPVAMTCGTVACMAGWACFIPEFRQAGLHPARYLVGSALVPAYDGEESFEALAAFFSISYVEAEYLFDNGARHSIDETLPESRSDWTPTDGALHLTAFIEHHGEVLKYIADDIIED